MSDSASSAGSDGGAAEQVGAARGLFPAVKGCTINQSGRGGVGGQRARGRFFKWALETNDFLFTQEAHLTASRLEILRGQLPGSLLFGSATPGDARTAGVMVGLSGTFVRGLRSPPAMLELVPGFCMAVICDTKQGWLSLVNLYGDTRSDALKTAAFRALESADLKGHVLLGGDLNFVESPADHHNLKAPERAEGRIRHGAVVAQFDRCVRQKWGLVEIEQDDVTWVDHGKRWASRLDRWYASVGTADAALRLLGAFRLAVPRCNRFPTDHFPVGVEIKAREPGGRGEGFVPVWAARHPRFPELVTSCYFSDPRVRRPAGAGGRGWSCLEALICAFREATRRIRVLPPEPAQTAEARLDAAISVLRKVERGDLDPLGYGRLLTVAPALRAYVRISAPVGEGGADARADVDRPGLVALIQREAAAATAERARPSPDPAGAEEAGESTPRGTGGEHAGSDVPGNDDTEDFWGRTTGRQPVGDRHSPLKRIGRWRPGGRQGLRNVRNPATGQDTNDPAEMARLLQREWAQVWSDPHTTRRQGRAFLRHTQYNKRVPVNFEWTPTYDEIWSIINAPNASIPGPDGIPHECYRRVPDLSTEVFRLVLDDLLAGRVDQARARDFNESLLFFIPKQTPHRNPAGEDAHDPDRVRPISVPASANRLLSNMLRARWATLAADFLHPAQKAFVPGRVGTEHVGDVAAFLKAREGQFGAAVLFDFKAAYPSLSHEWLFSVLEHIGVPANMLRAIRFLFSDVQHTICLGGQRFPGPELGSGIKQGCPLSPVLFNFALDALVCALAACPGAEVFVFADDIAVCFRDFAGLAQIYTLFQMWGEATNLRVNREKTLILVTRPLLPPERTAWRRCRAWRGVRVVNRAKYLGIMLSTDPFFSADDAFEDALQKCAREVRRWSTVALPMPTRILVANVWLISLFGYVSHFYCLPERSAQRARSLVLKFAMGFRFVGGEFLFFLPEITGIRPGLRDPSLVAIAQVATRAPEGALAGRGRSAPTSGDMEEHARWARGRVVAWAEGGARGVPFLLEEVPARRRVRTILAALRAGLFARRGVSDALRKKVGNITAEPNAVQWGVFLSNSRWVAGKTRGKVALAPWQLLLNGWPTRRRTRAWNGAAHSNCVFCGKPESDDIRHFFGTTERLRCPVVADAVRVRALLHVPSAAAQAPWAPAFVLSTLFGHGVGGALPSRERALAFAEFVFGVYRAHLACVFHGLRLDPLSPHWDLAEWVETGEGLRRLPRGQGKGKGVGGKGKGKGAVGKGNGKGNGGQAGGPRPMGREVSRVTQKLRAFQQTLRDLGVGLPRRLSPEGRDSLLRLIRDDFPPHRISAPQAVALMGGVTLLRRGVSVEAWEEASA